MSQNPSPKSARVAFDDREKPLRECRVDTGVSSRDADTRPVRVLQQDASVKLDKKPAPRAEGFDPYSTATSTGSPEKPRRTLDDMRKLSEEIKRNRQKK
jgi:hypothetical protein